jgi:Ca2+-binding RTX toxin-like protein
VRTVGDPVALPHDAFRNARQPIAQTFESDGERFTVVANHFKSKNCGDGATGANADTGDGQGCFNADRVAQAKALAGFVTALADASDDDDVIVLGDLNAYTREDPLDVLRASGLLDQRRDLPRDEAYSYVFDGGQGVLDHALATPSWDARRTGAAAWHLNADEPDAYEYDGVDALYSPGPFRSSDHDPLLLGYARDSAPTCFGEPATIVGTDAAERLTGTVGRDVIVGRGGDDLIVAAGGNDLVCGGAGDDRIYGNNGKDRLDGGTGDDELQGGNGDDELVGGAGADRLEGGNGDDRVVADAADTIHGGRGDTVVTRP